MKNQKKAKKTNFFIFTNQEDMLCKSEWKEISEKEKSFICGGGFFAIMLGIAAIVGIGALAVGFFQKSNSDRKAKVKINDWVDISWEKSADTAINDESIIEQNVEKKMEKMRAEIVEEVTESVISQHNFISRFYD